MTRSLIHFGQGAIMCHPFIYKEIEALENNDVAAFDQAFFGHIAHFIRNAARALLLSLTRGYLHQPSTNNAIKKYERKLAWASASFAFLADIAIIKFGGALKRKEKLNGRFGDILSTMYMAVCVLKKFEAEGAKEEDEVIVNYIMRDLFAEMQNAFDGLWQNLFGKIFSFLTLPIAFYSKLNAFFCPAKDELETILIKKALKSGDFRNNITSGIYLPKNNDQALAKLENALLLFERSEIIVARVKKAIKQGLLPDYKIDDLLDLAVSKNIIDQQDLEIVKQSRSAIYDAIQVDEYIQAT
jgi:acyl-CoA dehydrogenase